MSVSSDGNLSQASPGTADQPAPLPTHARPVWELVIEDMVARDHVGRERYGTPLQAGNGRDALVDLSEELLDAIAYTRQLREEMKCAGANLNSLLVRIAAAEFRDEADRAEIVSSLKSILAKNPVLGAV